VRAPARAAALLITALLGALTAGCGARSPDLFAVERNGADANARLTLVVNDGGSVTCNGDAHPLGTERLLRAREIARSLAQQAELHLDLPPGARSVLSYRVRLEAGAVSFSDTSANLPPSFTAVELFTKDVAEDVCGIER
jgi:hypothetical protein